MSAHHGKFVWYELMTTDAAAATQFYCHTVGWTAADAGMPGMAYTLLSAGADKIAGLMTMPAEACVEGAKPGWIGYVAVDDVDAAAAKAPTLGGTLHYGPQDIPGVGRFAVLADPQGAVFAIFRGTTDAVPPPADCSLPGHGGWHELWAGDQATALPFYAALFDWEEDVALPMGPMGVYQLIAVDGEAMGGMMTKPEDVPAPFWRYYFTVEDLDDAIARTESSGGKVTFGPQEVPGGNWIVHGLDPQGIGFALVGPRA